MSAPVANRLGWTGSGGAPPRSGTVFVAVYRLLVRSVATRGRLAAILGLDAVILLVAVARMLSDPASPLRAATNYANGSLSTLVPVAVLLFGAATLGDLIDDGSLVYLWLRPVRPWVHVLAAWAATVTVSIPLAGIPVVVGTAIIDSDPDLVAGTVVAMLVAVLAYSALFVTGGLRFRRAFVWGLAYILLWEGFVASAGETASKLAVRSYVRSILANASGLDLKLGDFSMQAGIVVPLAVGAVVLVYACRRLAKTDVA